MGSLNIQWSLAILCAFYGIGLIISAKTKGRVGSFLVVCILMLVGFLSGVLPSDIGDTSKITSIYTITNAIIIVNIGTTIHLRAFKTYWKLALSCLGGLLGLYIGVILISGSIFDRQLAFAAFPSLAGGGAATRLVLEHFTEYGYLELSGIVVLANGLQTLVGLPSVGYGVRKECQALLQKYRGGAVVLAETDTAGKARKEKLADRLPAKYNNAFIQYSILAAVSGIAVYLSKFTAPYTKGIVGVAILSLVLGYAARQLGIIFENPLSKTGLMTFLMFSTAIGCCSKLNNMTLSNLIAYALPLLSFFILGGIGTFLCSSIVGKLFGLSRGIVIAAAFSEFAGYPLNLQVALEIINFHAQNDEERKYLEEQILDKVVLGSVVSVTVMSILFASVILPLVFT